ncbi:MAG: exo-alpha-sialidase [Pyrinomonadaceae bacterium]|nr:exo-alpha-sialidase [Pyrinomonadaceae bacterium]
MKKIYFLTASFCLLMSFAGSTLSSTVVATTEDPKAMGYPDGRKVVRDAKNNIYVAFRKKQGGAYKIFVSKSSDNGNIWNLTNHSQPISVIKGSCNQRVPAIAIDTKNVLHLVWYGLDTNCSDSKSNERQIKYSSSSNGGNTWTEAKNIAPISGYKDSFEFEGKTVNQIYWQEHPVIYIDKTDKIYIVWEGRDAVSYATSQAKFIKSDDNGKSWTKWKNVGQNASSQSRPTIIVDKKGVIFVFVYGKTAEAQQTSLVFTTSSDEGATFSNWKKVSESLYDQRHVSAAIDEQNIIHLVWRQRDEVSPNKAVIKYAKYLDKNWTKPISVGITPGVNQYFPSISTAFDSQIIIWTETPEESNYPSEEPTKGKIVLAKKQADESAWKKSDLTRFGTDVWASIGWSPIVFGDSIDLVFLSGSNGEFNVQFQTLGNWVKRSKKTDKN